MENINRTLLKAINHKQWIAIEYKNKDDDITKYWIGVKNYHIVNKDNKSRVALDVDIFNVTKDGVMNDIFIYLDNILEAKPVEGTYYEESLDIKSKIAEEPDSIQVFENSFDDNILNYFEDCYKLDNTPYISLYAQVLGIDQDVLIENEKYQLSDEQFKRIISKFSPKEDKEKKMIDTLAMNIISINDEKGLYVLAYRVLYLNVSSKCLIPDKKVIINKEFILKDNEVETVRSARQFLDEEDYELLNYIDITKEQICDAIMKNVVPSSVDDSPHIMSLGRDYIINIKKEYDGIRKENDEGHLSYPLMSFFGKASTKLGRPATYPICLASEANLDQLLVIYQAMRYPVTFVQGPPGTGKTKTITNVLINALFNDKTVLVSTNNNVPLDGIFHALDEMRYKLVHPIPFPMLRLGSDESIKETLRNLPSLLISAKKIKADDDKIKKVKERYVKKKNVLKDFLEKYADKVDLEERLATLKDSSIKDAFSLRSFDIVDSQVERIEKRLKDFEDINEDNPLVLNTKTVDNDILMYLYFDCANRIKKIFDDKYIEFRDIIFLEDEDKRLEHFKKFIEVDSNLKLVQSIFPIIFTTNISAYKIGGPKPNFDLVVMDEAGQCNAAISLIPIMRGNNLLLVGDTCQLKPVIVLDPVNNFELKNKYNIGSTYDYIDYSILKMFYTNDTVSNIILLKNHYRCDPKIISFNNQKFYNKKLNIKSKSNENNPLVFVDCKNSRWSKRNTSMEEANYIINFCRENKNEKLGIITPFVNQRDLINQQLETSKLSKNVICGTIHEFQGDEKDIIIFSTAVTDKSSPGTYKWLINNKELFNVATSRAKKKLVILGNEKSINALHTDNNDIFYDLYQYVKKNGNMEVSFLEDIGNRALDIKPFSSELEKAFLDNLIQVIECNYSTKIVYRKEVSAAAIFNPKLGEKESIYFYACRFDFVLFDKSNDYPLLAIELCGPEHQNDEAVIKRDEKKKEICKNHNFDIVFIDNAYARRYGQLKSTLLSKLFNESNKQIEITNN